MSSKAVKAIAPLNDSVRRALELCEEFDAFNEYSDRARAQEQVKHILFRRIPEDPSYAAFVNRNSEFYTTYLGLRDIVKRNDVTLLEERFQKLRRGSASLLQQPNSTDLRASAASNAVNPPYPLSPTGDTSRPNDKLRMPEPHIENRNRPLEVANEKLDSSSTSLTSDSDEGFAPGVATTATESGSKSRKPLTGTYEVSPAIVRNKIVVSKVLMIDVRPHEDFELSHVNCPLITCFEPTSLHPGMSERDLEDTLVISSTSEFDSFAKRNEVDMIVLYDENSSTASDAPAIKIVHDTLLDAGRSPYVLRGGYQAWKTSLQVKDKLPHIESSSSSSSNHGSSDTHVPGVSQHTYTIPTPPSRDSALLNHPPDWRPISSNNANEHMPKMPQSPPSPPKHTILPSRQEKRSSFYGTSRPSPPLPPKEAIQPDISMPKVPEPLVGRSLPPYTPNGRPEQSFSSRSPPLPAQPPPPIPLAQLSRHSSFSSALARPAAPHSNGVYQASRTMAPSSASHILSGYADTPVKSGLSSLRVPKLFNPPQRSTSLSPSTTPSKFQDTRSTPPHDSPLNIPRANTGYSNGYGNSPNGHAFYHNNSSHRSSSDLHNGGTLNHSLHNGYASANGYQHGSYQQGGFQPGSYQQGYSSSPGKDLAHEGNYHGDQSVVVTSGAHTNPKRLVSTIGLKNLGNTCYMNCIIQCLLGVPQLIEPFSDGTYLKYINFQSRLGYKGRFANVFAHLVRSMIEHHTGYIAANEMKNFAGELRPDSFAGYEQQDCQEFLTFVLDGLHEDLNSNGDKPKEGELDPQAEEHREAMGIRIASAIEWERYLKGDTSLIVDLFQGQYLSRLQCMSCKRTSTTYNSFSTLSLPIVSPKLLGQQTSLKACFDEFVKPELLDGDNAWFCSHCKKKRRTVKTLQISRLPPVLVIHLKRFKRSSITGVNKLETPVDYPLRNLDLTRYWPQLKQSEFNAKEAEMLQRIPPRGQNPPFIYNLRAVTLHHGSLKGGHYTAIVEKPDNTWLYYDDSNVYPVKEKAAVSKQAYVLVYQRQM